MLRGLAACLVGFGSWCSFAEIRPTSKAPILAEQRSCWSYRRLFDSLSQHVHLGMLCDPSRFQHTANFCQNSLLERKSGKLGRNLFPFSDSALSRCVANEAKEASLVVLEFCSLISWWSWCNWWWLQILKWWKKRSMAGIFKRWCSEQWPLDEPVEPASRRRDGSNIQLDRAVPSQLNGIFGVINYWIVVPVACVESFLINIRWTR